MYAHIKTLSLITKNLLISSKTIDRIGINAAIERAIVIFLKHCLLYQSYKKIKIFVDGNYSFNYQILPKEVKTLKDWEIKKNQTTIVIFGNIGKNSYYIEIENIPKGDEKVFSVACASIVSKVLRDRFMKDISSLFPNYKFHQHKGYATNLHLDLLKKYGECILHRKSYKKKLQWEIDFSSNLYTKKEF